LRVKKQLIMVMGAQRSGTTALFRSLALDRALTSFDESAEDALYYLYRLRPVRETAPILNAAPGAVLLKPITETFYHSLEELKTEYANYALKFVWIYRDPVNVLHSMSRKGWLPCALESEPGASTWVARNQLALRFQKDHPAAIAIVHYEDLVSDPKIFGSLCKSLDVNGAPVFREDRGSGRSDLPLSVQRAIEAATGATLRALDSARSFRPRRLQRWKSAARAKLLRPAKRSTSATVSSPPPEWKESVAAAQPTFPADLEGLLFWLDADGIESVASLTAPAPPLQSPPERDWTIELGGSEADPGALFYGAIAEVILFGRRLIRTEQFAIAGYLKQKYQL